MSEDQQPHRSRQRPVSCRFCRSRKLRCSREAPCSNCVSRGVRCELQTPIRHPSKARGASEPELLERIRKLEDVVKSQKGPREADVERQSEKSDIHPPPEHPPIPSTQIGHLDDDVAWLKSIYNVQDFSDKTSSNNIGFRVCPIQQIIQGQQPYINQNPCPSSTRFEPLRCVWLPQYTEAKILVEKYIDDIDHVHHITHSPSIPAVLDDVYECLNQGQVKAGNIMLLLGIFAAATQTWVQLDCRRGLFSTCAEANSQSPMWIKAVEDVLDIFHRTSSVPMEGIQAVSITSFVLLNMEGYTRRCKALFDMALNLSRDLGLHLLDHPSNAQSANSARTEIGRRVWWYLVATDWKIPAMRFNDRLQGYYHCHPRHMMVRKPLNVNDEDVIDGMSCIDQPLSQPTTMSFSLQRLHSAEISRRMVDRTPLMMGLAGGPSHDVVMDIDTEYQTLLNDAPPFFSMSVEDLTATYQLSPSRAANIAHQGYMFYSHIHAHRCTLQFPYFSRSFVDPAYASSRDICLHSARLVIQTESQLEKSGIAATRYSFLACLVAVFMASIVVLMDLCYNKAPCQQEKHRGELAEAIRILEQARHKSETAARFLDSLMHVLRKHKVLAPKRAGAGSEQLSGATMAYTAVSGQPVAVASSSTLGINEAGSIDMADDAFANGEDLSSYFNELAQSFEQGIDVGSFDWNSIFSGLDSPVV